MDANDSFIIIQFERSGSANFSMMLNNVTPGQIFACLPALEVKAKDAFIRGENERLEKENENKLAVPKPEILKP